MTMGDLVFYHALKGDPFVGLSKLSHAIAKGDPLALDIYRNCYHYDWILWQLRAKVVQWEYGKPEAKYSPDRDHRHDDPLSANDYKSALGMPEFQRVRHLYGQYRRGFDESLRQWVVENLPEHTIESA